MSLHMKSKVRIYKRKQESKKERKFFFFFGRFLGRERVFFLFFLTVIGFFSSFLDRFLGRERVFFLFFLITSLVKSVFSCFLTFLSSYTNSHLRYSGACGAVVGYYWKSCFVDLILFKISD